MFSTELLATSTSKSSSNVFTEIKSRRVLQKPRQTQIPSDGGYICTCTTLAVQLSGRAAAQQLLSEVFAEALAHQVQSKRVHAGVGEGQDASAHAGDEVTQRRVHLVVVVGAVQIDHVTGEPADGEQADKHQDSFGQTLPGLDLTGEEGGEIKFHICCLRVHILNFVIKYLLSQGQSNQPPCTLLLISI